MAYIEPGTLPHEQNTDYFLNGPVEVPISSGGGLLTAGGGDNSSAAAPAQSISPQPQQDTQALGALPSGGGGGNATQSIFGPIGQQTQDVMGRIEDIGGQFREAAGPERSWEGIGGQSTMQRAISPGTPEADRGGAYENAAELLGARYRGPSGLDPQGSAGIGLDIERLGGMHTALGSGAGIASSLKQSHPNITPGMAQWEAKRLAPSPEFRNQRAAAQNEISEAQGQWADLSGETNAYATRRAEQEGNIASQARSSLQESGDQINQNLQNSMNTAIQQSDATKARQEEINKSWNVKPGEVDYVNPLAEKSKEAETEWNKIWEKYPEIAGIDPLSKSTHLLGDYWKAPGAEMNTQPDGLGQYVSMMKMQQEDPQSLLNAGYSPEDLAMLGDRQRELEAQFKSFGDRDYLGESAEPVDLTDKKYGDVAPLYFGTPYTESNISPFVRTEGGDTTGINKQQFASGDQVYEMNQINSLLGKAETMAQQDPWEAAKLVLDIQPFLAQEEERVRQSGSEADASARDYASGVSTAAHNLNKFLNKNREVKSIVTIMGRPGAQAPVSSTPDLKQPVGNLY